MLLGKHALKEWPGLSDSISSPAPRKKVLPEVAQPSFGAWAGWGWDGVVEGVGDGREGCCSLPHRCFWLNRERLGHLSLPRDLGVCPFFLPTIDSRPKVLALSTSSFQMGQHLAKAEAKSHGPDSSGLQELRESVYTDVLDRTCSQNWQS